MSTLSNTTLVSNVDVARDVLLYFFTLSPRDLVFRPNKMDETVPHKIHSTKWRRYFCYTDFEKAECLNKYFASISTINEDNCPLPPFELKCPNKLSNITCTADEIKTLINILNPNKAIGPDGISNKMLKPVAKEVAVPLRFLLNRSFREGKFAENWKHSNVISFQKKGDNSEPSNFRPVLLLSGLAKLQEGIAFKNIHNYLNENNLIYKYQSGFLPGHSTTFQLIDI